MPQNGVLVAMYEIYIIIYKHRETDVCEYGHILTPETYIIKVCKTRNISDILICILAYHQRASYQG